MSEGSAGCMSEGEASGVEEQGGTHKAGASRTCFPTRHSRQSLQAAGVQHLPLGPLPPHLHSIKLGLVVRPGTRSRAHEHKDIFLMGGPGQYAGYAAVGDGEGGLGCFRAGAGGSHGAGTGLPQADAGRTASLLHHQEQEEDADMWELCAVLRQVSSHAQGDWELGVKMLPPTSSALRKAGHRASSSGQQGMRERVAVSRQTSVV